MVVVSNSVDMGLGKGLIALDQLISDSIRVLCLALLILLLSFSLTCKRFPTVLLYIVCLIV